jgi:hypothetical protein
VCVCVCVCEAGKIDNGHCKMWWLFYKLICFSFFIEVKFI